MQPKIKLVNSLFKNVYEFTLVLVPGLGLLLNEESDLSI